MLGHLSLAAQVGDVWQQRIVGREGVGLQFCPGSCTCHGFSPLKKKHRGQKVAGVSSNGNDQDTNVALCQGSSLLPTGMGWNLRLSVVGSPSPAELQGKGEMPVTPEG